MGMKNWAGNSLFVEDTPTKDLGNELEKLIDSSITPATDALDTSAAASVPSVSLNYFNVFESLTNPTLNKPSRFWADQIDDLSDDGWEENVNMLREAFKRKATNSPDSNEFGIVLSKKEKKKLKQLLNKSN